jgi:hypothetical protein
VGLIPKKDENMARARKPDTSQSSYRLFNKEAAAGPSINNAVSLSRLIPFKYFNRIQRLILLGEREILRE